VFTEPDLPEDSDQRIRLAIGGLIGEDLAHPSAPACGTGTSNRLRP
jgi:hypothetical protein